MSAIAAAAARAKAWLTDAALPLWMGPGVDEAGAFHETLDFDGRPDTASFRRMRVQARQLYVVSEADLRGWSPDARAVGDRAFERFLADCWAPDGQPGFVHSLNADRTVRDARRDAYDHAFGLFALAWRHKATGDPRARALAGEVMDFMDGALADPHGGYAESIPPALPRRADPHMHWLEACLEWHEATGEPEFLERAEAMVDLFRRRFFDTATGTLGEYFSADLSPAPGAPGQATMPGHHFEWVWLLDWARRRGVGGLGGYRGALQAMAERGLQQRFAVDECDRRGRPMRTTRRAWPQTEMIKAHITQARHDTPGAADRAAAATEAFLDSYLATAVPGLWMDQFDADGRGLSQVAPASTLYHIVVAFREVLLLADERG